MKYYELIGTEEDKIGKPTLCATLTAHQGGGGVVREGT